MTDLRYGLLLPDDPEPVWLSGSATVGRHLDNDIVLAGEDVRDFHLRFETTARGPRLVVLEGATVHVDDAPVDGAYGLCPDDDVVIGRNSVKIVLEGNGGSCRWALHEPGVAQGIPVGRRLLIGRSDECSVRITEGHVSRRHALLKANGRWVWVKDLGSSNGTYVNGERLNGGCRLFHGDEVAFDQIRYQLIGDAPDLTPIRPLGDAPDQLPGEVPSESAEPAPASATVEIGAVSMDEAVSGEVPSVSGATLWGRSRPVDGRLFPLAFGRQTIGRGAESDIVIAEPSVSLRHAEIDLKPDGTYLVNLISTNGTWVNGAEIHTRRIRPGDVIHFGRVRFDYLEPRVPPQHRRIGLWWIVLLLAVGGAAAWLILAFT